MSLVEDLLTILTSYSGGYKLMRKKLMGYEDFYSQQKIDYQKIKDSVLRTTLSRLKKRGLIKSNKKIWEISQKGKNYLKNKLVLKAHFNYLKFQKEREKNMIIIFDIPEKERKKRDWLRKKLIDLEFIPIQKSVWFGPSPLPEEFIKYLNKINILSCLKFFKATKKDVI